MELKGYIEKCNVLMSSKLLKKFKYKEDVKTTDINLNDFDVTISVNATDFLETIKCMDNLGLLYLKLKTERYEKESRLLMIGKDDITKFNVGLCVETTNVKKDGSGLYNIDYLLGFLKSFKKKELEGKKLKIMLGQDYPLYLSIGKDWIVLAPRVEND